MRTGAALCAALLTSGCAAAGYWLVPERAGHPAAPAPANAAVQARDGVSVTVWPAKSAPDSEPAETRFGLRVENGGPIPARLEEPFAWLSDAEDRDAHPMKVSTAPAAVVQAGQTWEGQARFPGLGGKEDAIVLTVAVEHDGGPAGPGAEPIRFFFRYRVIHRSPEPRSPIAEDL